MSQRIRRHLDNGQGQPRCQRQLSRPETSTANQQTMTLSSDPLAVTCSHCLRAARLLPPMERRTLKERFPQATEEAEADE